ncbi:hypothetical protein [Flavihumibacter fluvii]|uniref:hypothetical protein n=1 Tax=Flavihumibacter fluvii TaxID=2838157 RepID=UPI001BDECA2D|nr:hypothetical protein [Flavihumibacter fluvii]ULQ53232.1 hypothetical protein KJS93_02745 [Flavihumibacter fluvii]
MNQVDQMQFRVSGMDAGTAQTLAKEVSVELLRHFPEIPRDIHVEEIRIQLNDANISGPGSLATSISDQIIRQIHEAIARGK